MRRTPLLPLVAMLLAATASAHGGQYRGPGAGLPVVVPGISGGPAAPRPNTGSRDVTTNAFTWQTWWEFNKEPFLLAKERGPGGPVTGSDDFYLGPRKATPVPDALQLTEADRVERIVPALAALIERDGNRDVQSACLVALGKVGRDGLVPGGAGVDLDRVLLARLRRDNQEVRETAVLALGIAGRAGAFDALVDLLLDTPAGRKLVDRERVRTRTRAFAAYGLGLLARRAGQRALSEQVYDALWGSLQDDDNDDRDLQAAIVSGIGVMRRDPARSADKRLAWRAVDDLLAWFEQERGPTAEGLQAHAPVAIARLLGRGTSSLHRRVKERFAATLTARERRGQPILQSCAIALGMLAVPAEEDPRDAGSSEVLRTFFAKGKDRPARQLALISLGRIAGATNREWLARAYSRAAQDMKPWAALALGLQAQRAAAAGRPDVVVGDLLLEDLQDASTDEHRAALALAVGLTGVSDAAPTMVALLRKHEGDARTAGYLAVGLGLLRDAKAAKTLREVMQRSTRRPFLLQQCAVGLGAIGDRAASEALLSLLKGGESVAVLASVASALARVGDRRAIDQLISLTKDRGVTKLGRAFAAAALGGVGDKDRMPWNVPLSVDVNYATGIDTLTNGATGVLDIL